MDFSKHIQKAEEASRRRNHDYAVELYRQLLDLNPDLAEARAGLRRALKARHERGKGSGLLGKVGGAVPLGRAKTLLKMGKHDAAARALEDYLLKNPLDEDANLQLGMALEAAGHYGSARAVYEFVAEIAPRNSEGLRRAGTMMRRAGQPDRALEYYERALEVDPRDQEALKARKDLAAEVALDRTGLDTAAHSRERIVDAEGARELERAQRRHRSEDELREELVALEDRYAEAPSDPDLLVRMAEVHERLRDPEAALELLERAVQYRKDDPELRARVGELRTKALKRRIARADKEGDRAEAERLERELHEHQATELARRVDERPDDAELRVRYARHLLRTDEVDAALSHLQRVADHPRVRAEALFLLGKAFQEKGVLDLACKEYERALEAQSGMTERAKEILYELGAIAESQGRREEARAAYVRIYEVDIGYRDVSSKMQEL